MAYLEDLFDEWAAGDQDPQYREPLSRRLAREFNARGKTVVATAYDDGYFDLDDCCVNLEYGKVVGGLSQTGSPPRDIAERSPARAAQIQRPLFAW